MKYIYWHKVKSINQKVHRSEFKMNEIIGFSNKEKNFSILNKECTDIEPYVEFKYLGRTLRTGDKKEDKKEFDNFILNLNLSSPGDKK